MGLVGLANRRPWPGDRSWDCTIKLDRQGECRGRRASVGCREPSVVILPTCARQPRRRRQAGVPPARGDGAPGVLASDRDRGVEGPGAGGRIRYTRSTSALREHDNQLSFYSRASDEPSGYAWWSFGFVRELSRRSDRSIALQRRDPVQAQTEPVAIDFLIVLTEGRTRHRLGPLRAVQP